MKKYIASATINAPAEKIWEILTDAESCPDWDLSMDRIEGRRALRGTVRFFTKLNAQAFPVKVTVFELDHMTVLTGGMTIGLFKFE